MTRLVRMAKIEIKPDHHILILGKTGSGKTFTTKNVLLPALRRQPNNVIVILDPKREYVDITDNRQGSYYKTIRGNS